MLPLVEVNHIWKEYQKGTSRRYKSLRDTLSDIPSLVAGKKKETFMALRDIDFRVDAGQSIGIIGRNGAGKSTLLKILSRITPPTKGNVVLRGRVASLLEVGTGFHPELTGRENIFFNGSVLGMKYREIKTRFDEIVDFSGVERFIDTPLKHFSSGMQMRLAFSVAAHLDAEILLIDEVLAVGDAEFQKKCLGKMDEISKGSGKSVLFVSHHLKSISDLTENLLILHHGESVYFGPTAPGIIQYQKTEISFDKVYPPGNPVTRISVRQEESLKINCAYRFDKKPIIPHFGFIISSLEGVKITGSNPTLSKVDYNREFSSEGVVEVALHYPILNTGLYNLSIWMGDGVDDLFKDTDCIRFEIHAANSDDINIGMVQPQCSFSFR